MIAILSTAAYDPAAPLVLRLAPGSSLDDMPVRVSHQQTLDGGAEADWRGQFSADRKMTLKAELTRAENDTLARWLRQHDRFTLSCESGFFVGVIENVSGSGGARTIRFLALEKSEPSPPPPPPPPPPLAVDVLASNDGGWRDDIYKSYNSDTDVPFGYTEYGDVYAWMLFSIPAATAADVQSAVLSIVKGQFFTNHTVPGIIERSDAGREPTSLTDLQNMTWTDGVLYSFAPEAEGFVYQIDVLSLIQAAIDGATGWTSGDSVLLRLMREYNWKFQSFRSIRHGTGPGPTLAMVIAQ